jgi:hypothetical protein
MPNQNDSTQTPNPVNPPVVQPTGITPPPVISPQSDLPPLPPAFQNLNTGESPAATETIPPLSDTGSAAPPDISSVIPKPKKSFGGGKIIATILGLFLLIGGVGAGIILTQQPQLLQQKAAVVTTYLSLGSACSSNSDCDSGYCDPNSLKCATPLLLPIGSYCYTDPNCDSGYCNLTTQKCDAKLQNLSGCNSDSECLSGYCDPIAFVCHPKLLSIGAACSTDSNCESGYCDPNTLKCSVNTNISCGGTLCSPSDCHCTGGDACTGLQCDPNLHQQCLSQGRAWCTNMTGQGMTCCAVGYVCASGVNGCVPGTTSPTPTPPVNPPAPYCSVVLAYDKNFAALTNAQLSALTPGTVVNFCVRGGGPTGTTFDQAKFTINGTTLAPTTTHRTGSSDFCQSYTILPTDTTVNVSAQIHSGSKWY